MPLHNVVKTAIILALAGGAAHLYPNYQAQIHTIIAHTRIGRFYKTHTKGQGVSRPFKTHTPKG